MNQETQIRCNPDGSIDTKYYTGKGRDCRSRAALGVVAWVRLALGRSLPKTANTSDGNVVLHRNSMPASATPSR